MTESAAGTPPAEIDLDPGWVQRLLDAQMPDLSDLPLRPLASGWDNVMFRLGDALCVRLPRREIGAALIEQEQRWLPEIAAFLAPHTSIAVPTPTRIGRPGEGYPWPWSVAPWIPGECTGRAPLLPGEADAFADFLVALHQPAPPEAPINPFRGVPLRRRADDLEERFVRLREKTNQITEAVDLAWAKACEAADAPETERGWIHADLHGQNVLADRGRLCGVIDWGDLGRGDFATDLAALWMHFPDARLRNDALARYGASPELVCRARGWAVFYGVMLLDAGLIDSPEHAQMGRATLEAVTREHP